MGTSELRHPSVGTILGSIGALLGLAALIVSLSSGADAEARHVLVRRGDIAPGAVTAKSLARGAVHAKALAKSAVHTKALAKEAVRARALAKGVVGASAIAPDAVTAAAIAPTRSMAERSEKRRSTPRRSLMSMRWHRIPNGQPATPKSPLALLAKPY
jgi:hypothetical protein